MRGRHDLAAFYNGAARVENFVTEVTGPARYRAGSIFANKTRDNQEAWLYTFQYSDSVAYIMEFTPLKIRFYANGGQVRYTAQNITGITKANPAVVTYSGSDTYANGDRIWISGVVGMTQVNDREFTVANVNAGANTFELSGVNSTSYTTYSSGGTVEEIVEVTTPYTASHLKELKFAQVGSTLYIAHRSYAPRKLVYTSSTSWAFSTHDAIMKSLGNPQAISAATKTNTVQITYVGDDTFADNDVVRITGVVGMTEINYEVSGDDYTITSTDTGTNTFRLSGVNGVGYTTYSSGGVIREVTNNAADFLTASNYPGAVGLYEERLVYGGSTNNPNTLWFSKPADLDDFTVGDEVDSGLEYTIAGNANQIQWLRGTSKFLAVGSIGDIFQVTGGIDEVVTPTSISIKPTNSYGCASTNPISRGTQVYFLQGNNLIVRSFEFDFAQDSYVPVDRTTVADHITKTGITQMEFQEGRPNVLWCTRNDGVLVGMTVEDGESVSGWHRHNTSGEYISIASLPRQNEYDQMWYCVKRVIEGVDTYYIEYAADHVDFTRRDDIYTNDRDADDTTWQNLIFEEQKEYIHVDCSLSYYGDDQSVTMTPSAATGDGITFTAGGSVFTSGMVGRQIWRKSVTGAETGRAEIVGYTSGTVVTCDIIEDFDSTTAIPAGEWYLTTDAVSGLEHLEGETVTVVVDGGSHPDATVTNGAITLDGQASVVHVGLGYNGYLETNDLEGGGVNGVAQTKKKDVTAIGFRFLDTLYAKYGTDYYNLNQIEMRTAAMRMDRPPEIFTGDVKVQCLNGGLDPREGGWTRSKKAIVAQDLPFPCCVQLIIPYFRVSN